MRDGSRRLAGGPGEDGLRPAPQPPIARSTRRIGARPGQLARPCSQGSSGPPLRGSAGRGSRGERSRSPCRSGARAVDGLPSLDRYRARLFPGPRGALAPRVAARSIPSAPQADHSSRPGGRVRHGAGWPARRGRPRGPGRDAHHGGAGGSNLLVPGALHGGASFLHPASPFGDPRSPLAAAASSYAREPGPRSRIGSGEPPRRARRTARVSARSPPHRDRRGAQPRSAVDDLPGRR